MKEEWRDISNYEGMYQVSNLGRVRSLDRELLFNDGSVRRLKGKVMSAPLDTKGFIRATLVKDGKNSSKRVHQLVAEAFLGHTPCGQNIVVDHKDNDRLNNNVENLKLSSNKRSIPKKIKINN